MYQIYKKIQNGTLSQEQLEFWRDRAADLSGPWADKIHNACILQLEKITTPLPRRDNNQTSIVEIRWKIR